MRRFDPLRYLALTGVLLAAAPERSLRYAHRTPTISSAAWPASA